MILLSNVIVEDFAHDSENWSVVQILVPDLGFVVNLLTYLTSCLKFVVTVGMDLPCF